METVSSTGDIWSTGAFSFESPLKDLLDRGDFTLAELLAEDELLQELRGMHPQLIDFLSTEKSVVGLVNYVIQTDENKTTTEEMNGNHHHSEAEQTTIRYPYMACEVICCEINSIIDTLVDGHVPTKQKQEDEPREQQANVQSDDADNTVEVTIPKQDEEPPRRRILDLLFSLLSTTPIGELDDYRAGYLEKILNVLFRKRSKTMSLYLNQTNDENKQEQFLLPLFMSHLYSHSIMQIVQRLVMPPPSSFLHQNEDDDDEEEEDDIGTTFFSCGWSELPQAIDLLLASLFIDNNNTQDEVLLDKSKCASQVLITVIQNSSLTSKTMLRLTTDPILGELCQRTYTLCGEEEWSRHDSSLTTAMNVLESIVLQLGGYGSVGTALDTSSSASQDQQEESSSSPQARIDASDQDDSIEMSPVEPPPPQVANADTLIQHLPRLLQGLSALLQHSSTETWTSPMQFNQVEPLLGMSRLCIVRLLESLVLLGNPQVDQVLCRSDCLEICLNLFWKFQWCSMLHQSVANLLVHVFEGANERAPLQEYFLVKCNLLKRLMDSFQEEELTPILLSESSVLAMQSSLHPPSVSVQSECGSSVGSAEAAFGQDEEAVLPVSDDDVDAAMEQQQQQDDDDGNDDVSDLNREASTTEQEDENEVSEEEGEGESKEESMKENGVPNDELEVKSSIPSLRMGCLGHVIIICQALVHACSAEMNESREQEQDGNEEELEQSNMSGMMKSVDLGETSVGSDEDRTIEASSSDDEDKTGSLQVSKSTDSTEEDIHDDQGTNGQVKASASQDSVSNNLVIAQLVNSHPLHDEWKDFITSTLAAETQIQSTPLGGTNVATVESMQSQLPRTESVRAYDFSDEDGDETGELGSREFFGGEVLDMDDNDLDIAASMMDALNLPRPSREGDEVDDSDMNGTGNQRHDAVSNSFGTVVQNTGASTGDYLFDDPLGGDTRFGAFGAQDDDSSDEEDERGDLPVDSDGQISAASSSGDDEDDTPVMDLFTGNFDDKSGGSGDNEASPQNGTFSDFANFDANFDDAFAAASATKTPISISTSSDEDDVLKAPSPGDPFGASDTVDDSVESLFGTTPPHSLLLGDEDEGNDQSVSEDGPFDDTRKSSGDVDPSSEISSNSSPPEDQEPSPSTAVSETPLETPKEENVSDTIETEPEAQTTTSG